MSSIQLLRNCTLEISWRACLVSASMVRWRLLWVALVQAKRLYWTFCAVVQAILLLWRCLEISQLMDSHLMLSRFRTLLLMSCRKIFWWRQWLWRKRCSLLRILKWQETRKRKMPRCWKYWRSWDLKSARIPWLVVSTWRVSQRERKRELRLHLNLFLIPMWFSWMSLLPD